MRLNIAIEDDLIAGAMALTCLTTRKATVE
jgi:Arc/MetJ family transcription regulator